jgi:hypothetical protein
VEWSVKLEIVEKVKGWKGKPIVNLEGCQSIPFGLRSNKWVSKEKVVPFASQMLEGVESD